MTEQDQQPNQLDQAQIAAKLQHLGTLAEVAQVTEVASHPEGRQFLVTPEQHGTASEQTELLEAYVSRAQNELSPEESTETAVWDAVFREQCSSLATEEDPTKREALALNILVGNAFASYGMTPEESKPFITNRLWEMAQTRDGQAIVEAAEKNIGLCAISANGEPPYVSVAEQLSGGYADLLKVTDKHYEGRTAVDTDVMQSADREQASWLIELGVSAGDMLSVGYNLADVNGEFRTEMAHDLLGRGMAIHRTLLRTDPPFCDVLPRDEVIDDALIHDPAALTGYSLTELPKERREAVISQAIEKLAPDDITTWMGYTITDPLSPELFPKLLETCGKGFIYNTAKCFEALPPGSLRLLQDFEANEWTIMGMVDLLDDDDQREILQLAEHDEEQWPYAIYTNPEGFRVISKEDFMAQARATNHMNSVANNLSAWTDGSDKELLLEAMNGIYNRKYSWQIACSMGQMPNLDKEWLLQEFTERERYKEIVQGMPHFGELIDQRQFIADRIAEGNEGCLLTMFGGFSQIPPVELYQIFKDNDLVEHIASSFLDFRSVLNSTEIYQDLLQRPGGTEAIIEHLPYFSDEDLRPLYDIVASSEEKFKLAFNFENFLSSGIPMETMLPILLTSADGVRRLLQTHDRIPEVAAAISIEQLVEAGFENGYTDTLLNQIKYVPASRRMELMYRAIEEGTPWLCADCLPEIGITGREFAKLLFREGFDGYASREGLKLYGRDLSGLSFDELLEDGAAALTIKYRHRLPDYSEAQAVAQLVDKKSTMIISYMKYLEGPLSDDAALLLARNGFSGIILESPQKFGPISPELVLAALSGDDTHAVELYQKCDEKVAWLDTGIKLLGADSPPALLAATEFINESYEAEIPAELQALGVVSKGQQGYEQLRTLQQQIRTRLLSQGDDSAQLGELSDLITTNRYAGGVARQVVRFGESEWGRHDQEEWQRTITQHLASRENHAPMPETFKKSEIVTIHQIDAKEFDPSKIDEDARNRYQLLASDMAAGLAIAQIGLTTDDPNKERYQPVLAQGKQLLSDEFGRLNSIRQNLVAQGNEKGLFNIDNQLQNLEAVLNAGPEDFGRLLREDFQTLGNLKIKGLDSIIRTVAFARAFTKSSDARKAAAEVSKDEISFEALGKLDNLVSYVVNDEVYKDFFTTDHARKSFTKITDTVALRNQLAKLQKAEATGETKLQFVPSRGLLLELSGHVADACWASKYDSIANEFPHISSLTFVRDPGSAQERLIGSCLLIDTHDEQTGEKVLVVRGINPIQNYIQKVKVDEFTNSLFNYIKSIAGNRRVAAVFDQQPGRAGTNRPLLHEYLNGEFRAAHVSAPPLNLPADTTFNDYVLSVKGNEPVHIIS
ncbi:MAG: hypothetical protein JWN38_554 [Candidatus Saccharibacteria bacterium]|nr:hypothetical protein [Candidatus Saccharibacteria bacterium]